MSTEKTGTTCWRNSAGQAASVKTSGQRSWPRPFIRKCAVCNNSHHSPRMCMEIACSSDAAVPTSSPPPYSQVIEPQLQALTTTYSVQTQIPAPPVDVRGYMQETAFHSGAPGFTTLLPCGAMGTTSYIAPPPGYAIQLQPYTTLIPVYPIGNPRQPYLPGYLGIAPNGTQSRIRIMNPQRSPHDYLPIAVLSTICCFWPTGIFAIIKALETRAAVSRGDHLSARISSRQARNYSFISLAVGISAMVLCAILAIVVAIEGKHRDTEWDP